MEVWSRFGSNNVLFQVGIFFRFHVNFQGCRGSNISGDILHTNWCNPLISAASTVWLCLKIWGPNQIVPWNIRFGAVDLLKIDPSLRGHHKHDANLQKNHGIVELKRAMKKNLAIYIYSQYIGYIGDAILPNYMGIISTIIGIPIAVSFFVASNVYLKSSLVSKYVKYGGINLIRTKGIFRKETGFVEPRH